MRALRRTWRHARFADRLNPTFRQPGRNTPTCPRPGPDVPDTRGRTTGTATHSWPGGKPGARRGARGRTADGGPGHRLGRDEGAAAEAGRPRAAGARTPGAPGEDGYDRLAHAVTGRGPPAAAATQVAGAPATVRAATVRAATAALLRAGHAAEYVRHDLPPDRTEAVPAPLRSAACPATAAAPRTPPVPGRRGGSGRPGGPRRSPRLTSRPPRRTAPTRACRRARGPGARRR